MWAWLANHLSCLANVSPPHTHFVLTQVLTSRKDSNAKISRGKILTPAPPEKKAAESSESSDEELPSSQVGHASFPAGWG